MNARTASFPLFRHSLFAKERRFGLRLSKAQFKAESPVAVFHTYLCVPQDGHSTSHFISLIIP